MKLIAGSYDNSTSVDNETEILAMLQNRSQEIYQRVTSMINISYGKLPRQNIDWFIPSTPVTGTLIFIHGGYWQFCDKEDFAFIAEIPLAMGFNVMLPEYTLAPQATLTDIFLEIGAALDTIAQQPNLRGPVYLTGHSAGGHLAACWQGHQIVNEVFTISGIFELEQLLTTYVNQLLKLSQQEISTLSPLRNLQDTAKKITLFYGDKELPELIDQSEQYYNTLRQYGAPVTKAAISAANHYTILDALFSADGGIDQNIKLSGINRMRNIIETGLPDIGQPFSWATYGGGMLFTAHGPVRPDGTIETGTIEKQINLTFKNLVQTLHAAGSHNDNVLQVIVYLTDVNDVKLLDEIYRCYFNPPYPNRSTIIVEKLVVPNMKIEITVTATTK